MWLITLMAVFVAAAALWLFLISGSMRRHGVMQEFERQPIAHRGLFGDGAPENSLCAFARAREHGYGVELDVQLTSDGELVVFHDETLSRMCGVPGTVHGSTYKELSSLRLCGTNERIPLFSEVLDLLKDGVPMIIEVKPHGDVHGTCAALARQLDGSSAVFSVESFDPRAVRWFKKNRPEIARGQLSRKYTKKDVHIPRPLRFAMTHLFVNVISRPDFIAYDHKCRVPAALRFIRRHHLASLVAWTVNCHDDYRRAAKFYDVIIFDSFIPDK